MSYKQSSGVLNLTFRYNHEYMKFMEIDATLKNLMCTGG